MFTILKLTSGHNSQICVTTTDREIREAVILGLPEEAPCRILAFVFDCDPRILRASLLSKSVLPPLRSGNSGKVLLELSACHPM